MCVFQFTSDGELNVMMLAMNVVCYEQRQI